MKGVVAILIAGLLLPVAAVAQDWTVYTYPDPGFTIQFPGVPAVATGKIKHATGVALPMTRYAVREDRIIYTLSIVDYSSTNADALSTISETERSVGASGKVTDTSGARVNGSFGRRLSLNGTDGSRSAIAIFFVNKHLYTLVGQALPPDAIEKSGDATRFQQSLQFLKEDGGFFGLFGSSNSATSANSAAATNSATSSNGAGAGRSNDAGEGRPRGAHNAPADATCAGKSAGDAVQLQTPGGPVAATCTLVARPNLP